MLRISTCGQTLGIVVLACGALGIANADERNPLDASLVLDAGVFLVSTDTRVRLDGEVTVGRGTDIDFDETFGIGDADRFRLEGFWRFKPRHGVRAVYFENNRSGTSTLDRDIRFGDVTFPVNLSAEARSDVTVAQLAYEYAFLRRERYEIAGSAGIYYADLGFTVTGEAEQIRRQQEASTQAPMPMLGLRGLWRLSDQVYVTGQAQYFYVKFDSYSGSLLDLKAALVWQLSDHVGLGVAYDDFRFRFDIEDEGSYNGRLRWDYGGLMAFASFMF